MSKSVKPRRVQTSYSERESAVCAWLDLCKTESMPAIVCEDCEAVSADARTVAFRGPSCSAADPKLSVILPMRLRSCRPRVLTRWVTRCDYCGLSLPVQATPVGTTRRDNDTLKTCCMRTGCVGRGMLPWDSLAVDDLSCIRQSLPSVAEWLVRRPTGRSRPRTRSRVRRGLPARDGSWPPERPL